MSREIDALVAEKVMGFVWRRNKVPRSDTPRESMFPVGKDFLVRHDDTEGYERKRPCGGFRFGGETYYSVPRYSTDIAATLEVVTEMSRRHETLAFFENRYGPVYSDGKWSAYFGINPEGAMRGAWASDNECQEYWESPIPGHVSADTPQMAICLAALLALGVEIK